jgi:hypothetical protein
MQPDVKSLPLSFSRRSKQVTKAASLIVCLPNGIKLQSAGLLAYEIETPFNIQAPDGGGMPQLLDGTPLRMTVGLVKLAPHFVRNYVRAAVTRQEFSDLLGPYLLTAITVLVCGRQALKDFISILV